MAYGHRGGRAAIGLLLAAAAVALGAGPVWAQAVIVRAGEAARSSIGVGDTVALTPPGTAALAQLKLVEKPGYRTPLHVHEQTDESFLVLEGELSFHAGGETVTLSAGDYVLIPKGTPHAQGNRGAADAVALTTLVPGDFAAFFAARAELVKTVPPDHPDYGARMRALGKGHDIRLVGPPPF